ncbi:GATA zinc finger domain-containing protein 1-like [Anopheles funestus]|uniref:GATA zinc finger domain-containing protein 1-like n=1 Tax=Anopheles funestus TaxID=62324 RepID=UPI0020C5D516|nr:GATA zinc finger domain-containing protein 1-like [Anopheles funestus]
MPPMVQRCMVCGTQESSEWHILDEDSVCSDCHDAQLNPTPESLDGERSPERTVAENVEHERDELVEHDLESSAEHKLHDALPCMITPKKTDGKKLSTDEHPDVEFSADVNNAEELDEMQDSITALSMFSPRRLRRRVCPVREPVRRESKKNGRTYQGTKAKSRRTLMKKMPVKSPQETASTKTVSKLLDDSTWYQIGDIVSMVDAKDNTYYAQIRGLIIDAFNEKSAVLTWLLPTTVSPPPNEAFDPATYLAGPDEDVPRRLAYMKFVMHAPTNYYLDRNNPYPRPECYGPSNTMQSDNRNYVWTSINRDR